MSSHESKKECRLCHDVKPITEYQKNKCTKDGHKHECRSCTKELGRRRYEANKDKIKEQSKKWNQANKDKTAIYRKRCKEKKLKLPKEQTKDAQPPVIQEDRQDSIGGDNVSSS